MTITLYRNCNPFVCTILFGLSESSKITIFKDLNWKIIAKIVETRFFVLLFTVTLNSFFSWIKSFITVILDDSDRPNIYMTITLCKTCNPFVCTILFCLSESSKITLIKDFIQEKNEFKVTVNNKTKKRFSAILASISSR